MSNGVQPKMCFVFKNSFAKIVVLKKRNDMLNSQESVLLETFFKT